MIYILNTEISEKKRIKEGLQNIFGIGNKKAKETCFSIGISEKTLVGELSIEKKNKIINYIEKNFKITENLREINMFFITKQRRIKCYKGVRSLYKLRQRGKSKRKNVKKIKK